MIATNNSFEEYKRKRRLSIEWRNDNDLVKLIKEAFSLYEDDMKKLERGSKEALFRIICLVNYLDAFLHPFEDGNLRINGHLLFLKELLRFGFKPKPLENYMIFEIRTPEQIFEIIDPQQFIMDAPSYKE